MFGKPLKKGRRYAIISDVHSNLHALKAVMEDADWVGADEILCAGDVVGYGAFPNEVIEELKSRNALCITGNHDRAVLGIGDFDMNVQAAAAVRWTMNALTDDNRKFLEHLEPRLNLSELGFFPGIVGAGLYHGSPFDDDEYILWHDATDILLEASGNQVVITGHTHDPFIKYLPHGVWLNPGSVGQPRDMDERASYFVYDEKLKLFQSRRIEYPAREAAQAIIDAGLPRGLGLRLLSGR